MEEKVANLRCDELISLVYAGVISKDEARKSLGFQGPAPEDKSNNYQPGSALPAPPPSN